MYILAGMVNSYSQFMQTILWISLVFATILIIVTSTLHYRRKKRIALFGETEDSSFDTDYLAVSPEQIVYRPGMPEHIVLDHTKLIKDVKRRLGYNTARYSALKHDYGVLQRKYFSLLNQNGQVINNNFLQTNTNMEILNEHTVNTGWQPDESLQHQMIELQKQHLAEKNELVIQMQQMNSAYQSLEEENRYLLEQGKSGGTKQSEAIVYTQEEWEEEKKKLKNKITEQEYLKDVLEEKQLHIDFLQSQLEKRVKSYHGLEQNAAEKTDNFLRMEKENGIMTARFNELNETIEKQDKQAVHLQSAIDEKIREQMDMQESLNSKLTHITFLENAMNELQQQNAQLYAAAAVNKSKISELKEKLAAEEGRSEIFTGKLESNKAVFEKMYKELGSLVNNSESTTDSQVIHLQADYKGQGDNMAV
jgi:DNA repair exonuclease SbcCD ATPase subunit